MIPPIPEAGGGPFFYPAAAARAAELKLAYAVEHGLEVATVVGDPGLGKTTLLRRAGAHAVAIGHAVADLFFPRLDVEELLALLASELSGSAVTEHHGRDASLQVIIEQVRRLSAEGRGLVIVLDDAHLLRDVGAIETLRLLLNLREREGAQVTLLLGGQRGLVANLSAVPAFAQRVAVSATLTALGREETADFVRQRLDATGRERDLFDDAALGAVHEGSGGVPRVINRLCDVALLIAGAEYRDRVLRSDVESALQECPTFGREAA